MNIAIIDDQASDLNSAQNFLNNYIEKFFPQVVPTLSIETFNDVEKFLRNFKKNQFELLILDIFMRPINGIHAAQIIRSRDKSVSIMFLTNSEDYILDGYSVFAVGYFLKPLAENVAQFSKTFAYIFPKILENQKNLSVPVKGVDILVPLNRIWYIDIDSRHHLQIHLQEKSFSTTMPYEKCFDALKDDQRFLECYHRILVNMDFIKLMDKDDFILQDGRKVPISQRKSKFAKLKYMSYLIELNPAGTL